MSVMPTQFTENLEEITTYIDLLNISSHKLLVASVSLVGVEQVVWCLCAYYACISSKR
jgi:hypothetical protein